MPWRSMENIRQLSAGSASHHPRASENEERGTDEVAPGDLFADFDVRNAPRQHERDDALPHDVEIDEENRGRDEGGARADRAP